MHVKRISSTELLAEHQAREDHPTSEGANRLLYFVVMVAHPLSLGASRPFAAFLHTRMNHQIDGTNHD